MPFIKNQISRQLLKRTATTGLTPTIGPTLDHTDGLWTNTDIYGGEFYWNMADQALWLGWATGTTSGVTLIYSGGTGGGGTYTADNGLTENPTNNFQLGGPLITSTQIDGASNTYSLEFIDLLTFKASAQDSARIDSYVGTTGGRFQIDAASSSTDWTFTDGGGNTTAFIMDGAKMYIQPPLYTLGTTGDYLRLKDPTTGECDYYPIPGTTSTGCITDFYVTNIWGCSPITMKDEVICESGLTATTISATTYLNLPPAEFTGGTITGATQFTGGLTANTISATTYQNLPSGLTISSGVGTLAKTTTPVNTNVNANTLLWSFLIPANSLQVSDFIEATLAFSGNQINGITYGFRVWVNTANTLTNATQVAVFTSNNAFGYTHLLRHFWITATGASGTMRQIQTIASVITPYANTTAPFQAVTINTTTDLWFLVSGLVSNATYFVGLQAANFRLTR